MDTVYMMWQEILGSDVKIDTAENKNAECCGVVHGAIILITYVYQIVTTT